MYLIIFTIEIKRNLGKSENKGVKLRTLDKGSKVFTFALARERTQTNFSSKLQAVTIVLQVGR